MTSMNGAPMPKTASENVLRALARATAEARAGNVAAVAVITVSPDGVPDVSFGGETELMPSCNLGADFLKAHLVQLAMQVKAVPVSGLVRPAGPVS